MSHLTGTLRSWKSLYRSNCLKLCLCVLKCLKIDVAMNSFFCKHHQQCTPVLVILNYKQGIQIFFSPENILCANCLWFWGESLLLNNAVCLSYLLIELVSDILDIASYNRGKFTLPVTIVSKEMVKKINVWLRKTFSKSYGQMTKCLANAVISELVRIMITYVRQRLQCRFYSVREHFEDFLWKSLFSPIPCYFARVLYGFFSKNYHNND